MNIRDKMNRACRTPNTARLIGATGLIIISFTFSPAQSHRADKPLWNWKKHRVETIDYAKKYLVSDIESGLPHKGLARWFRDFVGKEAKIRWSIVDCGEEARFPRTGDKDNTMCVEADAAIGSDSRAGIFIQVGTFLNGIARGRATIRFAYQSSEGEPVRSFYNLTDFAKNPEE